MLPTYQQKYLVLRGRNIIRYSTIYRIFDKLLKYRKVDKNDCRSMSPINMNRNLHPFKVCFTAPEDVGKQAKHFKYISTLISIECKNHISYAEVGEGGMGWTL